MRVDVNGMELHYDIHGDGEPLLWLHGGLGHGPDWRYIFTEPPAGYRLIAPDLRGHGRSTSAAATYSFKQSAADLFALLDHLSIDRLKVIGLSGGGITALHMATMQPARVSAMVVVSAPAAFPEQAKAIQRNFSEAMLSEAERAHARAASPPGAAGRAVRAGACDARRRRSELHGAGSRGDHGGDLDRVRRS